jgi:hypothetical protein
VHLRERKFVCAQASVRTGGAQHRYADVRTSLNREEAGLLVSRLEPKMKRLSRRRAMIVGAVLLGMLPLWTLPLMVAGTSGFLAYLGLSHAYYGGARRIFGATLFPAHEFGIVPQGAAGLLLAAVLYGAAGAAVGWGVAAGMERRSSRAD